MTKEFKYKDKMYIGEELENGKWKITNLNNEDNKHYIVSESIFRELSNYKEIKTHVENQELVSFYNNNIKFNIFQYKPFLRLIHEKNKKKCLYIADEVGAGKTFETGIIISEMLYSGRLKDTKEKIIIVCPNMLCEKWRQVLQNFFGISSTIISNYKDILSGVSIISFDAMSKQELDNLSDKIEFSLLIIDEAHNVGNSKNTRYKNILKFRKKSEYAVLLSATPLDGKENSEFSQIKMLFGSENIEEGFSFKSDGLDNIYLNKSLKDIMRDNLIECEINNVFYRNDELITFYEEIAKVIFENKNKLLRYPGINMISSSPKSGKAYLEKLLNNKQEDNFSKWIIESNMTLSELEEMGYENIDEVKDSLVVEVGNIKDTIIELIKNLTKILDGDATDKKFERLKEIIYKNELEKNNLTITNDEIIKFKEGNTYYANKSIDEVKNEIAKFYQKVVIFTNYNETVEYLAGKFGTSAIWINGKIDEVEKWKRFEEFKKSDEKNILIITNVACEGQDMDFCNTMINYDLHYNPVKLIQRRGRVDRFDVKKPKVFIYNFKIDQFDPEDYDKSNNITFDAYVEEINEKKPDSLYSVLSKKLVGINESTEIYYNIIDNVGESKLNIYQEGYKDLKIKEVVNLFNEFYNEEFLEENVKSAIVNIAKKRELFLNKVSEKINEKLYERGFEVKIDREYTTVKIKNDNVSLISKFIDTGVASGYLIENK